MKEGQKSLGVCKERESGEGPLLAEGTVCGLKEEPRAFEPLKGQWGLSTGRRGEEAGRRFWRG